MSRCLDGSDDGDGQGSGKSEIDQARRFATRRGESTQRRRPGNLRAAHQCSKNRRTHPHPERDSLNR